MKLLVIGGGGREHAIAWKLAQNPRVQKVFVAPGNAGTATEPGVENLALTGIAELAEFAARENVRFTVVGPEAPLAEGVVDFFRSRKLRIFGPTRAAAELESSKAFAKDFMQRHGIASAAGKGVVVAITAAEAHGAVDRMLVGHTMGDAGKRIVIEEFLEGEEASFIVMCDGEHVLPLATSQDHKRLNDGDRGPKTGGMGAYSPASVVTPELNERIVREIIQPVIAGMAQEGRTYTGFLYAGLMIGKGGDAKVLEFNCRLGDPETQPIMLRLKSDLFEFAELALEGRLH